MILTICHRLETNWLQIQIQNYDDDDDDDYVGDGDDFSAIQ